MINETVAIHTAIMRAAKQVERRPRLLKFFSYRPSSCSTPGCALGWVSFFAKAPPHASHHGALPMLGLNEGCDGALSFYSRMSDVAGSEEWKHDGIECARVLRRYANRFHPIIGLGFAHFHSRSAT